jgi:hypothetical protein
MDENFLSGMAVLDAAGTCTIPNSMVEANMCALLTAQDGGVVSSGAMRVLSRVVGVSITIGSTAGAADAGAVVFWQLCYGYT